MNNRWKYSLLFAFLYVLLSANLSWAQGSVLQRSIDSKILGKQVNYQLYIPEGYSASFTNFPVLYLLHGHGGSEKDWFDPKWGNMGHLLDSLIDSQVIPPLVAVTMDAENSWYVDSVTPMESFYLNEFIPYIENQHRIDPKAGRIIAGNSAGGYGALRFSLLKPELFKEVILLSPAAYEPSPPIISSSRKVEAFRENGSFSEARWRFFSYTLRWTNLTKSSIKPHFFLSTGDDDAFNIVPVVTSLQQEMLRDKIPCDLRIIDGGHTWDVWRNQIVEALQFHFQQAAKVH